MKALIPTFIFLLISVVCLGQVDSVNHDVRQAVKGAGQIIQSIFGLDLYKKHIAVDYANSRETGIMMYTQDFKNPQFVRTQKAYEINFLVITSKDTIANFNFLMDTTGKQVTYDYDTDNSTTPELISGYKRVLTNNLKISLQQATAIGKQKGFTGIPLLKADTDYESASINKSTYIKIKYLWTYFEFTGNTGSAILHINAETGTIEKERYIPAMPK